MSLINNISQWFQDKHDQYGSMMHQAKWSGNEVCEFIEEYLNDNFYKSENDNLKMLAQAVREMRELQKRYFKGEKGVLDRSKSAESRVDQMIEQIKNGKQENLF